MKLIDKDTLVAEIKKLEKLYCYDSVTTGGRVAKSVFISINDVFKSLEVKEVDLDFQTFAKEMDSIFALPSSEIKNTEEEPLNWEYAIAKHFFELGMHVNNPITAADRGMAEEIIINLKRVEKDYRIDLTREMEWLRNKVKKGE